MDKDVPKDVLGFSILDIIGEIICFGVLVKIIPGSLKITKILNYRYYDRIVYISTCFFLFRRIISVVVYLLIMPK